MAVRIPGAGTRTAGGSSQGTTLIAEANRVPRDGVLGRLIVAGDKRVQR